MISINWIGVILPIFVYFPYVFYMIFGKKRIRNIKHPQIKILETISQLGVLFFGFINFYGYGYSFYNLAVEIIWICLFFICILFNYFCWLRYFLNGRNEDKLYDKLLIPYPIGISECLVYFISGVLLFHPFVIIFSIVYSITHIYLGLRR